MKKRLALIVPSLAVIMVFAVFLLYTEIYYHADSVALASLETDNSVSVTRTGYGWFFDGPSEENALIFYPGAKIEEEAYAPLLHQLAGQGMDVCLVKMPFRLAFFGIDKADTVIRELDYENWYVGGHSLGGAMAADYAVRHGDRLTGVILLAAYPTKKLDDHLSMISIYGSEDGVLNMDKLSKGRQYAPALLYEYVIEGGNHAQFGDYGKQKGDGAATVSAAEQHRQTVDHIIQYTLPSFDL